jgi:RNA polymerase sigma-70 factor (ECF subfamily)
VISLRFAGELSIAEVARVMKKSEGAIKALQHSAIASLRRIMSVGIGP